VFSQANHRCKILAACQSQNRQGGGELSGEPPRWSDEGEFNEASANLASGSEDLSEKDVEDRRQAMMAKLTLPTFDDEDDEFSSR
jgi:hypothetical protein